MIEVNGITKKFGTLTAIQDISFRVESGMIYGLVGYNGAGKTTLLKTMADVYRPDSGAVLIDGEPVLDNPAVKQNLFLVPDDLFFLPYANMEQMAAFYKNYYKRFRSDTFGKLADAFGLDTKKRLNGFSKGMQRQAELVLGLSAHPNVLLLDESFDGLDPQKRAIVKNLVTQYVVETDTSVIISSHNLHELSDLCDRIGLINGKTLALDYSVEEMSHSRCKIRAVFAQEMNEEYFSGIPHGRFKKDGKIISFSTTEDPDTVTRQLQSLKPLLVEQFPLTLEEIFLEEMEGTDYDFSGFFKE
ncbi:MAG: ABC transporter ATP-binding protein [Clostridia bacterium]|nr:ABC transporter ATP-binding protein [Clostridia bacterium]